MIAGLALVLSIAAYSGASWRNGARIQAESELAIDALTAQLSKTWGDQIQLSEESYVRGVFSSQVTHVLSFASTKKDRVKPEIVFLSTIHHGPFPLDQLSRGNFAVQMASVRTTLEATPFTDALFKAAQGKSVLVGQTRIDMSGVSTLDWTAQPIDYTDGRTRAKFGGATLQAQTGAGFSFTRGELKVASLNISDGKSSIDLQDSNIYTDTHTGAFGLNIGTRGASIGQFTLSTLNQPTLRAEKMISRLVLNENAQLLDGQASFEIGALTIDQKKWGKINVAAFYDRLDGAALKSLLDLNSSLFTRSVSNSPETDLITSADLRQFWLVLQSLLSANPKLRIEPAIWQAHEGESHLVLKAAFAPAELESSGLGLTSNPFKSLEATLSLSRPVITGVLAQFMQSTGLNPAQAKTQSEKEIKNILDTAGQMKLGKMEGETFISKLAFDKNNFTVNNQKLSQQTISKFIASAIPSAWVGGEPIPTQEGPDETAEVKHLDPSVLAEILTAAHFSFEQTRDEQGDPNLNIAPGNSGAAKIDFSFIGCGSYPTCQDVLLRATYSPDKPDALNVANDWNLRNRWARAYVNDKQEAVIEMDINAYGGIGHDALAAMVNKFFKIVGDFSKELAQAK